MKIRRISDFEKQIPFPNFDTDYESEASRLDIHTTQHILANKWRAYIDNKDRVCIDATCYKSQVRYPTDTKLLYEAVEWNYQQFKKLNKDLRRKTIRSKITKQRKQYLAYSKSRHPSKKVKMLGAYGIYATNKNRNIVMQSGIKTDFKRKSLASKHKEHFRQLSKMITKERASKLKGSFGTDKEHFLLNRIKVRTQTTEILWIFFIHTSNALKIGRRMPQKISIAS